MSFELRGQRPDLVVIRTPETEIAVADVAAQLATDTGPQRIDETVSVDAIICIWRALAHRQPVVAIPSSWPADMQADAWQRAQRVLGDREVAFVLFTSGTTGTPRGIVHTRTSIAAAARASEAMLGWQHNDAWLLALPLVHAGGLSIVVRCLLARKPVLLAPTLEAGLQLAPTLVSLVPTQLRRIAHTSPPLSLRAVLVGGAHADADLVAAATSNRWPVRLTYGLTESFGQVATQSVAQAGHADGYLTPLMPLVAGTHSPDRIQIDSDSLGREYLDGPLPRPFVTRDVGTLDPSGLRVVGRIDDLIISGGENIDPRRIEAVVRRHPDVYDVAVVGIPDREWGQTVVAGVVRRVPSADQTAIARYCEALLAHYERPKRWLWLETLPTLPSGKVDYQALVTMAASEHNRPA